MSPSQTLLNWFFVPIKNSNPKQFKLAGYLKNPSPKFKNKYWATSAVLRIVSSTCVQTSSGLYSIQGPLNLKMQNKAPRHFSQFIISNCINDSLSLDLLTLYSDNEKGSKNSNHTSLKENQPPPEKYTSRTHPLKKNLQNRVFGREKLISPLKSFSNPIQLKHHKKTVGVVPLKTLFHNQDKSDTTHQYPKINWNFLLKNINKTLANVPLENFCPQCGDLWNIYHFVYFQTLLSNRRISLNPMRDSILCKIMKFYINSCSPKDISNLCIFISTPSTKLEKLYNLLSKNQPLQILKKKNTVQLEKSHLNSSKSCWYIDSDSESNSDRSFDEEGSTDDPLSSETNLFNQSMSFVGARNIIQNYPSISRKRQQTTWITSKRKKPCTISNSLDYISESKLVADLNESLMEYKQNAKHLNEDPLFESGSDDDEEPCNNIHSAMTRGLKLLTAQDFDESFEEASFY